MINPASAASNWGMPNRAEIASMADRMENNHAAYFADTIMNKDNTLYQAASFMNFVESEYYWTSRTDAADPSEAWTVFSCDFGVYDIPKSTTGYTLAVR
jgi:hypothetical protein